MLNAGGRLPAPEPRPGEDPITAQLVRFAAGTIVVLGSALALLLYREASEWTPMALLDVAIAIQGLVVLLLDRSGRKAQAAYVMVWCSWVTLVLAAAVSGGARGPGLLNFPVLIVFTGWVLGTRPTLLIVAVSAVAFLVFVWGDLLGWFPLPLLDNPLAHSVYLGGILVLTAAATLMSRRSYLIKLEQARQVAKELEARDRELRKLYLAVEQSPESIAIADRDHRLEYVNEAFVRNSGYARAELIGRDPGLLHRRRVPPEVTERMWQTVASGQTWRGELTGTRKDGDDFTESAVVAPIRQADGEISHYVALTQDITDRRKAEARIHHLAYYDALTGLPNRAQLNERLALMLGRASVEGVQGALFLCNIDRFKTINDARGQAAGDTLLVAIAGRLLQVLREGDVMARLAGDEFALLMFDLGQEPEAASAHALEMAQRIHADLLGPLPLGAGEEITLGASVGIAMFPLGRDDSAAEVLRRADTALHRAKEAGGGQTAFFEPGMGESAQQRFLIDRALRKAIGAGELLLYLQPQVDARGRCVAAEALVRWQHPEAGLMLPGDFIPVAEESGLIVQLDRWMLGEACRLMAREASAAEPLRLSVNVSSRHFRQPDFVEWFRALVAQTGVDPGLLTLEVTETVVIDDIHQTVARMRELASMGVHFSIDDFGTGYSSLAYLKRLPIDELKIDKLFVQDAPRHPDDAALVETILAVARLMRIRVVAEGVETLEQATFLAARAQGVIYQGYLFGKPEPAEQWVRRLREPASPFPVLQAGPAAERPLSPAPDRLTETATGTACVGPVASR